VILQTVFRENVKAELVEIILAVVRRSWPLVNNAARGSGISANSPLKLRREIRA